MRETAERNLPVGLKLDFSTFSFSGFYETRFLCNFGSTPGPRSCRPDGPQTHRDPHTSASRVLGLNKGVRHHCLAISRHLVSKVSGVDGTEILLTSSTQKY